MKTSTKTELIYACLIVVFVFVIYGNTINHGYNFDDEYVILNQQVQQGIKAIPDIFTSRYFTSEDQSYGFRPITKITFAIEYSFFGLNPKISHLINVLLYGLTGVLIFNFFVKNFSAYPKWFWLFVTLLFLSHPLHTEVVNSLKNREEILSFLFGFTTIFFIYKFTKTQNKFNLIISFLSISASILSKESGVIFLGFGILILLFHMLRNRKLFIIPQIYFPKPKFGNVALNSSSYYIVGLLYFLLFLFLFIKVPSLIEVLMHIILLIIFVLYIPFQQVTKRKKYLKSGYEWFLYVVLIFSLMFHFEPYGQIGYIFLVSIIFLKYSFNFLNVNQTQLVNSINYSFKSIGIVLLVLFVSTGVFYISYYLPNELLDSTILKLSKNQTPLTYTENSWASFKLSGEVFVKYLSMLFYPEKLLFYYGYNTIPIPEDCNLYLAFFVVFALGLTLILFFIKKTKSAFLFVFFLLVGMLFFSNLLFEVPGIIGDRLMYVASFGFCGLISIGLYKLFSLENKYLKGLASFIGISALVLYSFKTISRNADWQNKSTLYNADVKYLENSARANMIYADLLFGQAQEKLTENNLEDANKMFEASAFYYEKSLKVDSSNFTVYNNLGTIYFSFLADPEKAKYFLKQGLSKRFANYYAYNNLGMIYEELQKPDSALMYFKKSIDLNPTNTEGNFGMARVLHQQNKFEEAFTYYVKVLEKNPREIEAHEKMGDLLLQMSDTSNAIRFYQNVLKINSSRIDVEQKLEKLSY